MESKNKDRPTYEPKRRNYDGCPDLERLARDLDPIEDPRYILSITPDDMLVQIEYYNKHPELGIEIKVNGYSKGHFTDLDFTKKINTLENIGIDYSFEDVDFSAIYERVELKGLAISEGHKEFDFSKLVILHKFFGSLPKKAVGFEKCKNLKNVLLRKYQPKSKDLSLFCSFPKLVELELIQTNIETLEGLVGLNKLTKFELHYCRKVENLEGLKTFGNSLETIRFGSCPKIYDLDLIGEYCPNLKELLITRFRTIKDLDFVRKLPKLERILLMDGTVESLDLTPCLDLKNLKTFHIDNKKVYKTHPREIAQKLGVTAYSKR